MRFLAKLRGRSRDFPKTPCTLTDAWPPALSTSPSRVAHLLKLMNLHRHHLKSSFTAGFALGGIHCMHLDKCIMTCIYHYSFTQNNFSSVQWLSRVRLFETPWTAARQASLSITNSRSLLQFPSMELVMPSDHLIFCRPLLLLPSIFPCPTISLL